jgi:hypothetical protein
MVVLGVQQCGYQYYSSTKLPLVINSFSKFKNAGNDTITDFTLGNTKTNTNADIIDLSDLLVGYSATSNLNDFVTATVDGANAKLTIDHDGTGALNSLVTIVMTNTVFTTDLLNELITNGNLVLE